MKIFFSFYCKCLETTIQTIFIPTYGYIIFILNSFCLDIKKKNYDERNNSVCGTYKMEFASINLNNSIYKKKMNTRSNIKTSNKFLVTVVQMDNFHNFPYYDWSKKNLKYVKTFHVRVLLFFHIVEEED